MGTPLFLVDGTINPEIELDEIRQYIWYMETHGAEMNGKDDEPFYLGSNNDTAYYFVYDGEKTTLLDYDFLATITVKQQSYVIYADSCTLSDSDLQKWNITFKKIPRDIKKL